MFKRKSKRKINVEKLLKQLADFNIEDNEMKTNETSIFFNYVPIAFFRENREYLDSRKDVLKKMWKD
jgi:hypothetical protein